jgi:hypothetical protein
MDLFLVLFHHACDDYFYGYNETISNIHPTFEQAKEWVDSFLADIEPYGDGSI